MTHTLSTHTVAVASDLYAGVRGLAVSLAEATPEERDTQALAALYARTNGVTVANVTQAEAEATSLRDAWLTAQTHATDQRVDVALAMAACLSEGMTRKAIASRFGTDNSRVTVWLAFADYIVAAAERIAVADKDVRQALVVEAWHAVDQAKRNGLLSSESVAAAIVKGTKALPKIVAAAIDAKTKAAAEAAAAAVAAEEGDEAPVVETPEEAAEAITESQEATVTVDKDTESAERDLMLALSRAVDAMRQARAIVTNLTLTLTEEHADIVASALATITEGVGVIGDGIAVAALVAEEEAVAV